LLAALLAEPGVEIAPWARPWVTLWKFSLTSPSEADIRVALCPGCSDACEFELMRAAA
jgi:hypothetical protein